MEIDRPTTPHVRADPIVCGEFRRGRGYDNWRPNGSGDWLLIVTTGGAGRVRLRDQIVRLRSGDALLYSPDAMQDYATDGATGRWHLRWAHFQPRPHWLPWLAWPRITVGTARVHLRGSTASAVQAAMQRLVTSHRLGGEARDDLALNALEEALLWIHRFNGSGRASRTDERAQRAVQYLAAHPDEPFDLVRLASHCGLSASRLSHVFKAEIGTTPQRFSEDLRLKIARQLVTQTNLPIGAIAAEVGFEDPLYFSRRFRQKFKQPPTGLREGAAGPKKPRRI